MESDGVNCFDFSILPIDYCFIEVYYTTFGKKYHTHDDCQALTNSKTIYHGPIADALDAGRTELCKFCAEKDGK